MSNEPKVKRAVAFFDGQNLFYAAREAFGYRSPSYDPQRLAQAICARHGWRLAGIRFYTGIPERSMDAEGHRFWTAKLAVMSSRGVQPFSRALRYQTKRVALPGGRMRSRAVAREKGIDVRMALDIARLAQERKYDVALIFSQDQDLSEAVDEVRMISRRDHRWIKLACAFPSSRKSQNRRGINNTSWIRIDRALYDACLDQKDYGRKRGAPSRPAAQPRARPRPPARQQPRPPPRPQVQQKPALRAPAQHRPPPRPQVQQRPSARPPAQQRSQPRPPPRPQPPSRPQAQPQAPAPVQPKRRRRRGRRGGRRHRRRQQTVAK